MTPPGTRAWTCLGRLDPLEMLDARRRLAEHELCTDLAELDDDDVWLRLRDREEYEDELESRNRRRDAKRAREPVGFTEAVDLRSLVERHDIAFLVLDGAGKPFTGVPYELREQDQSLARASSGSDGMVRRSGVTHDDYTLTLVEIDEVRWVRGAPGAGTHVLEIACSGIADGTALEVLLFEELREQDDEKLAKLSATVQGDRARVSWTVAHDELAAIADDCGGASIIAEVRGPEQRWRKTEMQLALVVPCAVSLTIGDAPLLDVPIELSLRTRGVADGTAVTLELWTTLPGAAPEQLTTLDGMVVKSDRATASWTFAPPGDDPLRLHGGECWAVAKLDAPGKPSCASALTFVASA
jgi:hypothetical protein